MLYSDNNIIYSIKMVSGLCFSYKDYCHGLLNMLTIGVRQNSYHNVVVFATKYVVALFYLINFNYKDYCHVNLFKFLISTTCLLLVV